MNVRRFAARNSREALNQVRQALGGDAIVLSTRPCAEGIEVLAMAPDAAGQLERAAPSGATASVARPAPDAPAQETVRRVAPAAPAQATSVAQDAEALAMSTLSFQDYVRERMLRRRRAEMPEPAAADAAAVPPARPAAAPHADPEPGTGTDAPAEPDATGVKAAQGIAAEELAAARRQHREVLDELRAMKGLIEARFGALAFMEKLQRQPRQARLSQKMLDCGFSPSLVRTVVTELPPEVDELEWALADLARRLPTGDSRPALEDAGGVYALIGATGVGKTTSTAKLAAAFAARHGASQLGLITLDAYRVAAHEQLRAYGRILGVPVHTAHDRASLEDLLELLGGKRMVLIDTAGMAQRDGRTSELLELLSHRSIQRLLVLSATAQGETIEDQIDSYRGAECRGVVLSKIDEAIKIGPALDAMIRFDLEVVAVANGQRVPEDWHRLSSATLVQHAWRSRIGMAWRHDDTDIGLVFAGAPWFGRAAGPQTPSPRERVW